jgi:hypothetical protein
MKFRFLIVLAVSAVFSLPHAAHAACRPGGTTLEKIECEVTADFLAKHVASSADNAKVKDKLLRRNSTYLLADATTLALLRSSTDVARSGPFSVNAFYCVYTPATPTRPHSAACTQGWQRIYLTAITSIHKVNHLE